jgi:ubiquinone/menaquinone biosynthesis C-methylase UbiE
MAATDFDQRAATWDDDPVKRERAAAVATAIRARVNLSGDMTALEYGAGTGLLSFELTDEFGSITLADSSEGMLDVARAKIARAGLGRRVRAVNLDLTRDPLPDARYDIIYSMMTLHHVPDTAALFGQFHILLNPGGHVCVADLDAEDGSFHGAGIDVHHGFERGALADTIRGAGFAEVTIDTCFEIRRGARSYPVFLAVAQRV